MAEIKVTVRLFGAFRKYGENAVFLLQDGVTVGEMKKKMAEKFDADLVRHSVLANDDHMMTDDMVLRQDARLAVLPPVCGG